MFHAVQGYSYDFREQSVSLTVPKWPQGCISEYSRVEDMTVLQRARECREHGGDRRGGSEHLELCLKYYAQKEHLIST